MANRSLVILRKADEHKRPVGLEQSRRSKMAWLAEWRSLLKRGFEEAVLASCEFGSIHQKEFRILLKGVDAKLMDVRCSRSHHHVRVQGKYTKASAVYVKPLAEHIAKCFAKALRSLLDQEVERPSVGHESVTINDLLVARTWTVCRSWRWRRASHINVLEVGSAASLMKESLLARPCTRFTLLLDSLVARGALAKGRSSAVTLVPMLQRCCALQIAGGLQPSYAFAPTRYNTADAPTRDRELPVASKHSLCGILPIERVVDGLRATLTRPLAGWARLALFLCLFDLAEGSSVGWLRFPVSPALPFDFGWTFATLIGLTFCSLCSWIFYSVSLRPTRVCMPGRAACSNSFRPVVFVVLFHLAMAPLAPNTLLETERARLRTRISLVPDRAVREKTRTNRHGLLQAFAAWLRDETEYDLDQMLAEKPADPEKICEALVLYGRDLFSAGKSYQTYSETVNSVAAARPLIRKQLSRAWDLAFAWLQDEPHSHHPAFPASLLMATLTVCLMWGWLTEAGIWALTWAGLLRIGEAISAVREDLVLPFEAAPGTRHVLLRVNEPKTRGRGARHQSARVDQSDLVQIIAAAFKDLPSTAKLWPLSASTLRKRFVHVLKELGVPVKRTQNFRPYDLASLRAGGATWLLTQTENLPLVQRRGRWAAYRSMEIYLQEISVATVHQKLDENTNHKIQVLAAAFTEAIHRALFLVHAMVPPRAWPYIFHARCPESRKCREDMVARGWRR